jgi:hypothetical protein
MLCKDANNSRSPPSTLNSEPEEELDPRLPDPVPKPLLEPWPVSASKSAELKTSLPSPPIALDVAEEEEVEDSEILFYKNILKTTFKTSFFSGRAGVPIH